MRRKFLAVAMATTLLTTTVTPSIYANAALDPNASNSVFEDTNEVYRKQKLSDTVMETTYKDNDIVTIIVELNDLSLLERFNDGYSLQSNTYDCNTITSYLATDSIEAASVNMLSKQSTVIDKIEGFNKFSKSDIDILYNYTTVMNGFAITARYSLLDRIRALPEVKSAYVGSTYALEDPAMTTSNGMINSVGAWDLNYQGEGMVVAILDTGLDTSHEAFTPNQLTSPRLIEAQIDYAKKRISPVTDRLIPASTIPS